MQTDLRGLLNAHGFFAPVTIQCRLARQLCPMRSFTDPGFIPVVPPPSFKGQLSQQMSKGSEYSLWDVFTGRIWKQCTSLSLTVDLPELDHMTIPKGRRETGNIVSLCTQEVKENMDIAEH